MVNCSIKQIIYNYICIIYRLFINWFYLTIQNNNINTNHSDINNNYDNYYYYDNDNYYHPVNIVKKNIKIPIYYCTWCNTNIINNTYLYMDHVYCSEKCRSSEIKGYKKHNSFI
jgi:hypothetical protein